MHRLRLIRPLKGPIQPRPQIIRIQHSIFRRLPQPIRPIRQDVRQSPDKHPIIPVPGLHPPHRLRPVKVEAQRTIPPRNQHRRRQKRLQNLLASHRPRPRTPTPMRRRKRLMQIQMHHIDPKVPRPRLPHQRVHIRAIHIQQRALRMQNVRDLMDVRLKHPNRRRIRQHQRRRILIHQLLQRRQVHHPQLIRLQIADLVPADRRRRRVRPMRRVRHNHLLARISLRLVIRPRQQNPRKLPMRARRRLQRNRIHARNLNQALTQQLHQPQRALAQTLRLVRMRLRQSLQPRHGLINPRVVLHRARPQRIHPQVNRIIPRRKPRKVPNNLNLTQLRHHP